jgi:HAD superfamily hydrolase (TIGR01509 family)
MWACYQRVLLPEGFNLTCTANEAYRLRGFVEYNLLENTVEALYALGKENISVKEALQQPKKIASAIKRHPLLKKNALAKKLKADFRRTDLEYLAGIPPIPQSKEALIDLSTRYKTGIVSNSGSMFNHAWMKQWKMDHVISAWIGEQNITRKKPDPQGILECARALRVQPSFCLFVGDAQSDMIASKAAGATGIGVLSGTATNMQLKSAGATEVYNNLFEASKNI